MGKIAIRWCGWMVIGNIPCRAIHTKTGTTEISKTGTGAGICSSWMLKFVIVDDYHQEFI